MCQQRNDATAMVCVWPSGFKSIFQQLCNAFGRQGRPSRQSVVVVDFLLMIWRALSTGTLMKRLSTKANTSVWILDVNRLQQLYEVTQILEEVFRVSSKRTLNLMGTPARA
jgi:hypothetical protein